MFLYILSIIGFQVFGKENLSWTMYYVSVMGNVSSRTRRYVKVLFPDFSVDLRAAENVRFGYFALIWWQTDKKQEILKQSCEDLFIWTKLPIVWLIIGSDNIFNIEVNGTLAIHFFVHYSLTQNQNKLKFWI